MKPFKNLCNTKNYEIESYSVPCQKGWVFIKKQPPQYYY